MPPQLTAVGEVHTKRIKLEILRAQLDNERSSFIPHWRDLSDHILPRRARFTLTDANKGDKRNQKIIDGTATLSARSLRSGMMGGITSPARPWFRLTTPDPKVSEFGPIKQWLHEVSSRMRTVFLRSNIYNVLPIIYGDMGVFATGCMFMEEDLDSVVRFYSFPIGSYMLANDERLQVRIFFREFRMTVRQLIKKYASFDKNGIPIWDNFSVTVRNQYENNHMETWIDVCHAIIPNENADPNRLDPRFKKFKSVYYEKGFMAGQSQTYIGDEDRDRVLRESGYDYFPVLAARWEVTGEDAYGTQCPGMEALGDIKQLQLMQKRKAQIHEKHVNPPMTGPTELKHTSAATLPGHITYFNAREGTQGFKPVYQIDGNTAPILGDIQDVRLLIQRAFYEDLFKLLILDPRRQPATATEIKTREEEKLLLLGPVLEQLNQDVLDPLIDNTFDIMAKQGLIPEPPQELQGSELKVEYISIMAQAQKLIGIGGIERFSGFVGGIAASVPDPGVVTKILDKVDIDQMIDEYGDAISLPPTIIRSDDDVEAIRDNRQQAEQAAAAAEQAEKLAGTAKNLSQSDTGGENALTDLVKQAEAGEFAQVRA